MDLIGALITAIAVVVISGLAMDRIRGVARRAEGRMIRVLQGIPDDDDRERWEEELRRVLLEFDGYPLKQSRESRDLIRAAKRLVSVYAPNTLDRPRKTRVHAHTTPPRRTPGPVAYTKWFGPRPYTVWLYPREERDSSDETE